MTTLLTPPPGHPRFAGIDALRGLAALMVLGHHFALIELTDVAGPDGAWWYDFALRLNVGVAVFFAISGFVMYRPFMAARVLGARRQPWSGYAISRVLRIVPAYWVALLAFQASGTLVGDLEWFHFAFAQIYVPGHEFTGVPPVWTLCTEVAFYALLPAVALLAARLSASGRLTLRVEVLCLGAACLASLGFRSVAPGSSILWLPGLFGWFGLGMILATVSVYAERDGRSPHRFRAAAPCLALAALLTASWIPLDSRLGHVDVTFILYGTVGAGLLFPVAFPTGSSTARRLSASRMVPWLGNLSYGVFLYHLLALKLIARTFPSTQDALRLVGLGALTVLCSALLAWISFVAIERPALTLRDRLRAGFQRGKAPRPDSQIASGRPG